jgi:predicted CopG family antitoxin
VDPTDYQTAIAKGDTLLMMPKRTSPSKPAPEQTERTHVTSGINLPVDVYQLLNRVAFSRSLKNGGRPSVSGLLVQLVERHRKELEKELGG